jgi:hypothetical protein
MNNMSIAKIHKFSRKFVGWITAVGPVVALAVSILTIVIGVIIYATKIWPGAPVYWVSAGGIGILFSILVERLTLTQAAKVRTIKEKKDDIETRHAKVERPTKDVEDAKERALDQAQKGNVGAWSLMLLGVLVSTAAGTLFWHYLLQALPPIQAWGFSTLFSAIVSFTLVSSELHRHLDNDVISSSIVADHFIDMAGREDARDKAIERFGEKHDEALEKALDHNTIGEIADYTAQKTLDEVFKGEGEIPKHIQREREARRIANEAEARRTEQQMEIIRERKPKDEKPKGLIDRIGNPFKQVDPERSSSNGNGNHPF